MFVKYEHDNDEHYDVISYNSFQDVVLEAEIAF